MTDEIIPGEVSPVDSSSDGSQTLQRNPPSTLASPLAAVEFGASPLPEAICRISQVSPRSLGGEIGATLIAAATTHLSHELLEKKTELRESRNKTNELEATIARKNVHIAVLSERIESVSRGKHIRNTFMVLGTALLGFAVELFRNSMTEYAWSCAFIGAVIILGTWLSAPKVNKEVTQ